MEDALALTRFAESVTLIHRRDAFKASQIMQDRVLANPKVKVLWNTVPVEVKGNGHVETLVVEDVVTHAKQELSADGVFVAIGHKPATELFSAQIQLDPKQFIVVKQGLEAYPTMTSVDGVFAAGDCVDHRYKQAITSAGMGAMASLDVEWWLDARE